VAREALPDLDRSSALVTLEDVWGRDGQGP